MTRIYIVRHAEAEGNLYRRIHGWYNSLITDNGYRQIEALKERFETIKIDAVYSSDLFRTQTTATAVYKPKGLPLVTLPGLREINMGTWEDRPWGEIAHKDGGELDRFSITDPTWQAPQGEGYDQVAVRMKAAIMEIAHAHPGETVAVFSHGTVIRTLLAEIKGQSWEERRQSGHSDNTAVSCVEAEGDKLSVVFENDNSHLSEEISTLARQRWWKSREGSLADANLWFRSLDMEREGDMYLEARREAWVDIHGPHIPFDGQGFLDLATRRWAADHRAVRCAMLGDRPVGLLELDLVPQTGETAGYVPFVYMMPHHRRQGLGVQLIGEAISIYRPMGRKTLRLRCAPDNDVAQRFYKRYGFHKIGEAAGARVRLDLLEKDVEVR